MALKKDITSTPDWDSILKTLPLGILCEEQKRRLALKKKVTEIPDRLLNAELKKRRSVPWEPIDL